MRQMGVLLTIVGIVLGILGVGGPVVFGIGLSCLGIDLWRGHKHKQEIDSLKQENVRCTGWTIFFGSLALLFLVLALAASRKTA